MSLHLQVVRIMQAGLAAFLIGRAISANIAIRST